MSVPDPLEHKVARTRRLLSAFLDRARRVAVAWTGGKDSGVVLWLWRGLLAEHGLGPARALCVDTGLKFPEVVALRGRLARDWGLDLVVARPDVDIAAYPAAEDKVACCRELKIAPLKRAVADLGLEVLLTGLRRDEHPSRAKREFQEQRRDPDHLLAHPILDWTEMDVWAFITGQGLPYCGLYDQGYRSLGCAPCTARSGQGERSGRDPDKEDHLEALRDLGYF
ncbi:MAG: phosphoadenosine phosphosulfate reductase family protein [Desulfovibrionaceae bacterium]|nr:phosphoadenosine phosphosulfate reductase family protein [Desulfovibrionaceae bacterium]